MSDKLECPETSRVNPVKAIRLKCLDCSGGLSSEVEKCPVEDCPLYPFRFGKNPFRTVVKRELSDEQRDVLRERMRQIRNRKT